MRYFLFFIIFFTLPAFANSIDDIINKFGTINNIKFDFNQTTSTTSETGNCIIVYPSHMMKCIYDGDEKKVILVKDNHLYIIKYKYDVVYPYPIKNSIFSVLLNKDKIFENLNNINKVQYLNNKIIVEILTKDQEYAKIYFDKDTKILKGWETTSFNQEKVNFNISNESINVDVKETFTVPSMIKSSEN